LFEPVYDGFTGIEISDPSAGCVPRVSTVDDVGHFPLLPSAQLPPQWQAQHQFQQIVRF